jgi:2,4-dienoyl-CoA reductase-like NADH-dependent reductase (Old Yellow Enzyme family)
MPDLFSPFTLKGVTLRNRIAMSPMTMYGSVDGQMDDYHVMYLGARAAGGFGLVFPEQIAITPTAGRRSPAPASGTTTRSRATPGSPR